MSAPFIIVRGAPGAGKSTFAQKLRDCIFQKHNRISAIFETDNFFVDSIDKRTYHFNRNLLGIAHSWNQGEVIRACRDCPDMPVIVANTFRQRFELKPYFEIAQMFGRKIFVFTLYTEHDNVHGVPDEKVKQMRLGMHKFNIDTWLIEGYPLAYSKDIMSDEEAAKVAQLIRLKSFEES